MEGEQQSVSSATAVFLGALAPGVNGPTWNALKGAFLMLGVCLCAMLGLAFSSSDLTLVFHVTFLVLITTTLFFLLTRLWNYFVEFKGSCIIMLRLTTPGSTNVVFKILSFAILKGLTTFLAQTGLVSVEHQMQEIGLVPETTKEKIK